MNKEELIENVKFAASQYLHNEANDVYAFDVVRDMLNIISEHTSKEGLMKLKDYFNRSNRS